MVADYLAKMTYPVLIAFIFYLSSLPYDCCIQVKINVNKKMVGSSIPFQSNFDKISLDRSRPRMGRSLSFISFYSQIA